MSNIPDVKFSRYLLLPVWVLHLLRIHIYFGHYCILLLPPSYYCTVPNHFVNSIRQETHVTHTVRYNSQHIININVGIVDCRITGMQIKCVTVCIHFMSLWWEFPALVGPVLGVDALDGVGVSNYWMVYMPKRREIGNSLYLTRRWMPSPSSRLFSYSLDYEICKCLTIRTHHVQTTFWTWVRFERRWRKGSYRNDLGRNY